MKISTLCISIYVSIIFLSILLILNNYIYVPIFVLIFTTLLALCLFYDYRFRKHWTGYTFGYPLKNVNQQIFLTFDDGPSGYGKILKPDDDCNPITDKKIQNLIEAHLPNYDFAKSSTENLLDLLDEYDVKAIFFVWGQFIDSNAGAKKILDEIVKRGHIIGNHSYSHLYSTKEPTDKILADFVNNHNVIKKMTGISPTIFRPPYGDWEPNLSKKYLARKELSGYAFPMFWTDLFKEWALTSHDELAFLNRRLKGFTHSLEKGQDKIILLHDIYIPAIILTKQIIETVRLNNYSVGDPGVLVDMSHNETDQYKKAPFNYYLIQLVERFLVKLQSKQTEHTNYRMDR